MVPYVVNFFLSSSSSSLFGLDSAYFNEAYDFISNYISHFLLGPSWFEG